MTISEVLIAMGLAALLLLLVSRVFVFSLRSFSRSSTRAGLYQAAGFALNGMERDFKRTRAGLVTLHDTPSQRLVALIPFQETLPDGIRVWSGDAVLYEFTADNGLLRRRTYAHGLPLSAPTALTPSALMTALAGPFRDEKLAAHHVRSWDVGHSLASAPRITMPFRSPLFVTLELRQDGSHQSAPEVYRETRTVTFRN